MALHAKFELGQPVYYDDEPQEIDLTKLIDKQPEVTGRP